MSWVSAGKLEDQDGITNVDVEKHVIAVDLPKGDWIALEGEGRFNGQACAGRLDHLRQPGRPAPALKISSQVLSRLEQARRPSRYRAAGGGKPVRLATFFK